MWGGSVVSGVDTDRTLEPLFPDLEMKPLGPAAILVLDQAAAAERARRERVANGDHDAGGGRGRTRQTVRHENNDELWTLQTLKNRAQREVQRQLTHKDPKIRRDAAKTAMEIAEGKWSEGATERAVIYLTAALNDSPDSVEELEALAATHEREVRERYVGASV